MEVGVENVVVLGRKAEERRVTWERFEVGSTSTQTTVGCVCGGCALIHPFYVHFFFHFQEKLFLTATNVQSTMAQLDSLPDPWVSPSH